MELAMTPCFSFQAEDGIRVSKVTGVQTCALPIYLRPQAERQGQRQKRQKRRRPDQVPYRGRRPPESQRGRKPNRHHQRSAHYKIRPRHCCSPCFLAVSIIWEMRSRSFEARLAAERSSRAATVSSTLPAKNVDTMWRSADLRAISRATVGRYT